MVLARILELWIRAWPAGLLMLALGSGFAVILLIAGEKLKVRVDPRIERIYQVLPGLDCGACGFAGCMQYAKAVSEDAKLLGLCAAGGQPAAQQIAAILNLQISDSQAAKRPIVHCRAHNLDKHYYARYHGLASCTAANALADFQACNFGCLGFGDCVEVCRFDAIRIVDGLATVDYEKCTGCGACSKACPRNIIEMVPFKYDTMMTVACRSRESGKNTRAMCKVGCIGCGLCSRQSELFSIENNLARLDYEKYRPGQQADKAMKKCPTGVIVYRGKGVTNVRAEK